MVRKSKFLVLGLSFIGMGLSMPSCPGQQAMQQQIDALQTANADLNKKLVAMTTEVSGLTNDMNQLKQLMPQLTNSIQAQKGVLDELDATVKQMKSKGAKKKQP